LVAAIASVGRMAIVRVKSTRFQRAQLMFMKPCARCLLIVTTNLHDELAGVRARHRAALAGRQYAHAPHVQGVLAVLAACGLR